jgi:hypothetical protein
MVRLLVKASHASFLPAPFLFHLQRRIPVASFRGRQPLTFEIVKIIMTEVRDKGGGSKSRDNDISEPSCYHASS